MKNWSTANAVYGNPINKVGLGNLVVGAHRSREETESVHLNIWKTQPPDVRADGAGLLNWREIYGDLWKLKIAFEKQHNG